MQKALREASAQRQVIEEAWPKMYDLLIKMAVLEHTHIPSGLPSDQK